MRNRVNNLRVFIPKSGRKKTNYPALVADENGSEQLVTVSMSDSEFTNVPTEDFSLKNLLRAGVSPENMSVNTSSFNKISDISSFDKILSGVDMSVFDNILVETSQEANNIINEN